MRIDRARSCAGRGIQHRRTRLGGQGLLQADHRVRRPGKAVHLRHHRRLRRWNQHAAALERAEQHHRQIGRHLRLRSAREPDLPIRATVRHHQRIGRCGRPLCDQRQSHGGHVHPRRGRGIERHRVRDGQRHHQLRQNRWQQRRRQDVLISGLRRRDAEGESEA